MNAAVKLLAVRYPAAQITWARFTGHLIVMLIVFLPQYRWALFRTRRPARADRPFAAMLVSNLVFVIAIGHVAACHRIRDRLHLAALVTALSVPLLHESVGWRRWSAVVVGFAGALMVIRPQTGAAGIEPRNDLQIVRPARLARARPKGASAAAVIATPSIGTRLGD